MALDDPSGGGQTDARVAELFRAMQALEGAEQLDREPVVEAGAVVLDKISRFSVFAGHSELDPRGLRHSRDLLPGTARSRDSRRLRVPVEWGSSGLPGNTSNRPRDCDVGRQETLISGVPEKMLFREWIG